MASLARLEQLLSLGRVSRLLFLSHVASTNGRLDHVLRVRALAVDQAVELWVADGHADLAMSWQEATEDLFAAVRAERAQLRLYELWHDDHRALSEAHDTLLQRRLRRLLTEEER